jgi:hypothetical protein
MHHHVSCPAASSGNETKGESIHSAVGHALPDLIQSIHHGLHISQSNSPLAFPASQLGQQQPMYLGWSPRLSRPTKAQKGTNIARHGGRERERDVKSKASKAYVPRYLGSHLQHQCTRRCCTKSPTGLVDQCPSCLHGMRTHHTAPEL